MVIKEVLALVETSVGPVARMLHKNEHFNVLVIGFKKGMLLKEHKASRPSKLTILTGSVMYREGEKEVQANQYEEVSITENILHSVEALENSLCLLTQG